MEVFPTLVAFLHVSTNVVRVFQIQVCSSIYTNMFCSSSAFFTSSTCITLQNTVLNLHYNRQAAMNVLVLVLKYKMYKQGF